MAAGIFNPHQDIPILQATVILEGSADESCSAEQSAAAVSTTLASPACSSGVSNSWPGMPGPLARSTSDVTSNGTNNSNTAGLPAPLLRSISDVTSHFSTSRLTRHSSQSQQPSQTQQQCRPGRQRLLLLQQLHARAKPAATASALQLAGTWWYQDEQQLSELLLLPDGTMAWLKQSHQLALLHSQTSRGLTNSMAAAASKVMQLLTTKPQQQQQQDAAADSCGDSAECSWSLQPYECVAEWRGSWRLVEGNARKGKLLLTFLASSLEEHQHGSVGSRNQQQKQQQAEVHFERGALKDVLLLNGAAHVRLS
jgi:hypothetical protein